MIAIIDYGIGNLASITNALNRLRVKSIITANPKEIKNAEALILPGVGAAGSGMKNIKDRRLDKILRETIYDGKPFLGICLGMQLLFEKSEEGQVKCLGVFKGMVKKFRKERKVPQIGWNTVGIRSAEFRIQNLFKNIPENSYFYFVNSYYCVPEDNSIVAAETEYGERFASIVSYGNIFATQFHPEKSGKLGFLLLKNFIRSSYVS